MSDAIVCMDQHLNRLIVIKSLKSDIDPQRLLDELAALQEIRSKHVVQIYDVIRDNSNDISAIVEEYLPGDDLFSVPLPSSAEDLIKILYQIAEGIEDVHAHGRVHRDIKPNNMKFDDEGCLKIFDFGLSRLEATGAITTDIVVTPGFAAPELFLETVSGKIVFTQAVDVFAFGATALFLATGDLPAHLQRFPPKLPASGAAFGSIPHKLPTEIITLLNACFEAVPASRPSMSQIREALGRHILKGRHRALLVSKGQRYVLDASNRIVNLSAQGLGALRISYDGQRFVLGNISGYVSVNNMMVGEGHSIEGSCVIILGAPAKGMGRVFITFDIAHPEVTI